MNKKITRLFFLLFAILIFSSISAIAQESSSTGRKLFDNESDIYYYNLPILRVAYHKMGFYVVYKRQGTNKTGECYIPHSWFTPKEKKGILDSATGGVRPYMRVVLKNGEFDHVKLVTSPDFKHNTWGIISNASIPDEKFDIETLDIKY